MSKCIPTKLTNNFKTPTYPEVYVTTLKNIGFEISSASKNDDKKGQVFDVWTVWNSATMSAAACQQEDLHGSLLLGQHTAVHDILLLDSGTLNC